MRSLCIVVALSSACGETESVAPSGFTVQADHQDVSPPLRDLRPPGPIESAAFPAKALPRHVHGPALPDPVLQSTAPAAAIPSTVNNFEGVGEGFVGPAGTFSVNAAPPDTNGDVGPNHYVQIVNSAIAIWNKSGTVLYGPVATNTLWSGFGGGCQTNNDGDGVAVYDSIADRWIIGQFSVSTTPYLYCVAVSQTADPLGPYYRYSFSYTNFPDYPKVGVWPDGYYVTFNFFNGSGTAFLGGGVCAYDRAKMLIGQAATQQCFSVGSNFGGLLPGDLDGPRLPPAGAANPVLSLGATDGQLAYWKFHVDWATPASSSLVGPTVVSTAAYMLPCNDTGGTCVPQSGTTQKLDTLGDRLMYRLGYRNFGDHQALVANHSIAAGSSVGVRWYELRLDGSQNPTIFQQGTYAPDASYRWMGAVAMDQSSDIAAGFSVSSSTLNPRIHYAGRLATDAAGMFTQGEGTLIDGTGSQKGFGLSRWGDYSMLAVDPSDDCTFWYTNQYLTTTGAFNWHTRIGSFKFVSCPGDFSLQASPASVSIGQGRAGQIDIAVSGAAQNVTLIASGLPSGTTASFMPNPVVAGSSSTMTLSVGTSSLAGTSTVTITGTGNSFSHSTSVQLIVAAQAVITSITRLANGTMELRGTGTSGASYRVQASTDLTTWADIGTAVPDSSGHFVFDDTQAPNFASRFYRLASPP